MSAQTQGIDREKPMLLAALGDYPHTRALKSGKISSDRFRWKFSDIPNINRAFAPMVRDLNVDVCEMALATFLQAKAYGKGLVLLPIAVAARFQEQALLCLQSNADLRGPADLVGRRIGVRSYAQTTGMWIRGILADEYNIKPREIDWVTFEGAHVAEYSDPPWTRRALGGKNMFAMLQEGELDSVIVGNEIPNDVGLRTVFVDTVGAAQQFWFRHSFIPVNYMVTVRSSVAKDRPDLVAEILRLLRLSQANFHDHMGKRTDALPVERSALEPIVALALRYATEQGLLPRPLGMNDIWAGLPKELT